MKTAETFDLKPGQHLYKFTDEEIQDVSFALSIAENEYTYTISRLQALGDTEAVKRFTDRALKLKKLQHSIENQEHNV